MLRTMWFSAAACLLLVGQSFGTSYVPDPDLSTANLNSPGHLMVSPAGTGPSLSSRGLSVSVQVISIIEGNQELVAGYPFQDVYVAPTSPDGVALCLGGWVADANTDATGTTTISGTPAAGGWTESGIQVFLGGTPLNGPMLELRVNSPDINGDLWVNMIDLSNPNYGFAALFLSGVYDFRVDFNDDGAINMIDLTRFATHLGDQCN